MRDLWGCVTDNLYCIICYGIHRTRRVLQKHISYFENIKREVVTEKKHEVIFAWRLRSSHSRAPQEKMEVSFKHRQTLLLEQQLQVSVL
jgi:hypothetical protein